MVVILLLVVVVLEAVEEPAKLAVHLLLLAKAVTAVKELAIQ
jgi:hypothetical protein